MPSDGIIVVKLTCFTHSIKLLRRILKYNICKLSLDHKLKAPL